MTLKQTMKDILNIKTIQSDNIEKHCFLNIPIWKRVSKGTKNKIYFLGIRVLKFNILPQTVEKIFFVSPEKRLETQLIQIRSFNIIKERRNSVYQNNNIIKGKK